LPDGFYSSDAFADRLIDQFQAANKEADDKPFFALLTFTAPHWPLQAPREDIARYRGRYDAGFEVLRQKRLKRQEELGLLAPGTAAHQPRLSTTWDGLTLQQKREAARNMEIYAAMVDRLDRNVGRVLNRLRQDGELDDTVVIFLADNGAEGLDPESAGRELMARYLKNADNSLQNRGSATSYVAYGPGWAQAATAPSWLIKGYASEGGTRATAFVRGRRIVARARLADAFTHVTDIVPTILDLAGMPETADPALRPITGKSWVPYLTGKAQTVRGSADSLGTELFGSRSMRRGEWKITDIGDGQWRLFDLASDPGETRDLAGQDPARLRALTQAWDDYAEKNGIVLPNDVRYRP